MLQIIKLSTKTWKHVDSIDGAFILTKFYAKEEFNEFLIVESYGAKRRKYLISEIEVYDIGGTAETFANFNDLFLRLEALKYIGFYQDGNIDLAWGSITGTLSDQTDLQSALDNKQDKLTEVNFGAFMDTELPIKLTPSLLDSFLVRDYVTNEAVEVLGSDLKTLIGAQDENNLYRSFFQYSARNDASGIVALNAPIALVTSGTQSVVSISGTSKYSSIPLQNYLSATPNGSNCGWKQGTLADGVIRQGFDVYMIWANNDANSNCMTTVGSYSLTAAIPNLDIANFTGDFFGVGNDVGDTNLSFYSRRVAVAGQTDNYVKVATSSSFPSHTTTDAYMLRMQAPCTEVDTDRYIKMTLTNIITGATISHTFPYTETPVLFRNFLCVINRSNRNTGVATNIRPSKIHYSRLIY